MTVFSGCEEVADLTIDPIESQPEFTFAPETGSPGSVVEIIGANLSDVQKVAIGTAEAEISSKSDNGLKVIVPVDAETGKIHLTFADKVYSSENNFSVSSTPVPAIASFQPLEVSRGDEVTITGSLLDQVKSVYVGEFEAAIVSQSAVEIVITAPEGFTTASIYLNYDYTTTYGMVKETSAVSENELGLLLPSISSVDPGLSGLDIGDVLTLNGSNLDLVDSIGFDGVIVNDFTYTEGEIIVAVPEGATSGTLRLYATDGTYEHETSFGVALPSIDSFTPQKGAAEPETVRPFSILGNNLHLVDSVKVGNVLGDIVSQSESQLLFSVGGTTSGLIYLFSSNGMVTSSAPFAFVGDFWVNDWDNEFAVDRFSHFQNNNLGEFSEAVVTGEGGNNYAQFELGGAINNNSFYMWGADNGTNDRFSLYVSRPEGVYIEFDMRVPEISEASKQEDGTFKFKLYIMDALGWGASGEYSYGYNGPTSYVQTDGEWQHFKMHLADFVASGNGGLYTVDQVDGTEGAFLHPNSLRIVTFVFGVPTEDGTGSVVLDLDNVKFSIE